MVTVAYDAVPSSVTANGRISVLLGAPQRPMARRPVIANGSIGRIGFLLEPVPSALDSGRPRSCMKLTTALAIGPQ
jgi:hypothetical protein